MSKVFTTNDLASYWGIDSLEIVGQFVPIFKNESYGLLVNLMGFDAQGSGRILMHPLSDQRLSMQGFYSNNEFKQGEYYRFKIRLPEDLQLRLSGPSDRIPLRIDKKLPVRLVENPYRKIISSCFDRFDNPDANKVLASLLQEVGRGLYSSKKRMFFELLQNADDLPTGMLERPNDVHIYVEGCKGYLLIMNNGQPFNEDDVRSVTSAAESTKLRQNKKTGYKGIGFKSVFTDSTKVVIKSGGFTFEFDKQAHVFRNFEELYINNHPLYRTNSDARAYFLERHGKNKAQYERIESVPWHLKPLWNSSAIDELADTAFYKNNNNVGIALNFGQTKVAEYLNEFSDLFADPRFLLFLRNTTRVQLANSSTRLEAERIVIKGSDKESKQETEVRLLRNTKLHSTYLIQRVSVPISNAIFQSVGVDVLLQSKEVAGEQVSIFCNAKGDELPIPSKLATFSEIQLHLAAPLVNGSITAETRKSFAGTSIYTYLPMKEGRIQLPVLVNADFVPSSDREKVQADNAWNHFLFYKIGYQLVDWIAQLAVSSKGTDYLNLLPPKPLNTGDTDIEPIEAWFNKGYEQGLNEIAFIAIPVTADEIELVKTDKTVINDSELLSLFDHSFFYAFTGITPTTRRIPESGLDTTVLKSKYFQEKHQVQVFTDDNLIVRLTDPNAVAILAQQIAHAELAFYQTFLERLNQLVEKHREDAESLIRTLPFLRFGSEMLSWSAVVNRDNYLLLNNQTEPLRLELTELGFILSDFSIDETPALKSALQAKDTYLGTDSILYDKVSARCVNLSLSPTQKAKLFTFFEDLDRIGKTKFAQSLCLFADESGVCRPLDKLLSRAIEGVPDWLLPFRITAAEFAVLPQVAKGHLVKATNLFSQLLCDSAMLAECTKHLGVQDLPEWVKQLKTWRAIDSIEFSTSWNELPWLYTNEQHRFKAASQLWDHEGLEKVPAQSVIERLTGWLMPHSESRNLISHFKLSVKSAKLSEVSLPGHVNLSEVDAKNLLAFLIKVGESHFLTKYQLVAAESGFQIRPLPGTQRLYTADGPLSSYINSRPLTNRLIQLPQSLASMEGIETIGLLADRSLVEWLVNNDATLMLTPFVASKLNLDACEEFVKRIKLPLHSDITYEKTTPESQFILLVEQIHKKKDEAAAKTFIDTVRGNTTLNSESLDKWRVNDRVRIGNKNSGFYKEVSLSELLPDQYKGVSDVANRLVESFSHSNSFIRKELFASKELTTAEVADKLRRLPFLSPMQVLFRQMQARAENFSKPLDRFRTFAHHLSGKGPELTQAWVTYLTLLYEEKFNESFGDFWLYKYVDTSVILDETEKLPDFLSTWADTEEKIEFLCNLKLIDRLEESLGFNGANSNVVKLRKAILAGDDSNTVEGYFAGIKKQKVLVHNTVLWLAKQSEDIINLNLPIIKSILAEAEVLGWSETYLLVVDEVTDERRKYQFKKWTGELVHFLRDDWEEYSYLIQQTIRKKGGWLIDNMVPDKTRLRLKPVDQPYQSVIRSNLTELCRPFDAPYYLNWDNRAEYPVYIYESGDFLPYDIWYNGVYITEDKVTRQVHYRDEKTIYLTQTAIDDFPLERPEGIPYAVVDSLAKLKYTGTIRSNRTAEPDTDYSSGIDSIKHGQELPKAEQKNIHPEAVKRCRAYLEAEGYDFSSPKEKGELSSYEYDSEVKSPNGNFVNVYYRSAKGGLLYLNPGLWKKLAQSDNLLVVIYEDGQPRVFDSQGSLLQEKYNRYMLYRVVNDKNPDSVTAVAKQLDNETGHLLFVTGPNYAKRLFDVLKPQPGDSQMDDTSTGLNKLLDPEW